jgi:hypothetical protein
VKSAKVSFDRLKGYIVNGHSFTVNGDGDLIGAVSDS